ncbi:Serine/threonine-protein kinase PknB [Rubripirellula tenax]|uniref:non-specific serine/threonine protein kinase n=1 Tax=Rubripirellula tenax TaxID=2528015 RepID=A0A5C6F8N5_9BACT|nr:protein kinase [Rubripirellula tenax]TWU56737.1 Serine/threonine-protein kinase PknB [Rubripirellula tenax]
MNRQQLQTQCNPDALEQFLQGTLGGSEAEVLELHLTQCESCAEQIQLAAQRDVSWQEAQNLLAADEYDSPEQVSAITSLLSGEQDAITKQQTADVLSREIRGWLDPTDDPQSLGRFAGYEIVGIVGHGGMGIVLKGFESSLNRYVAIKVLAPRLATNGNARKRFAREAQAAAAVRHDNVIAIHRVDDWHGLPFLVMPYVGGISLQKRIDTEGSLNIEQTLRVGVQIASGLAAAHAQGLVHRDIKPANILLEQGVERVTITDFGLARAADDASVTRTGVIAGTPQYMSPEQADARQIDARSDLFSLGSVLYAMATGRPPFRGDHSFEVLKRIVNEPARPMREIEASVPEWFEQLVARLHCKFPNDRFDSAEQVADLLEDCLAHVQQPTTTPLPEAVTNPVAEVVKSFGSRSANPASESLDDFRYPPIGKLIAAAAFGFSLIFAGVLIVLELNKGTLKIESDVDDVPIRILQAEKVVEELTVSKQTQTVRVAAGKYVVEVDGDIENIEVLGGEVVLNRRGVGTVKIVQSPRSNENLFIGDESRLIQRLQGKWRVVRIVDPEGADYQPQKISGWTIEGHTMTTFGEQMQVEIPFRLDETQSPAQFDLPIADESNSDIIGLIDVTGDRLKVINSENTGGKSEPIRPVKLEPALGFRYVEMERVIEAIDDEPKVTKTSSKDTKSDTVVMLPDEDGVYWSDRTLDGWRAGVRVVQSPTSKQRTLVIQPMLRNLTDQEQTVNLSICGRGKLSYEITTDNRLRSDVLGGSRIEDHVAKSNEHLQPERWQATFDFTGLEPGNYSLSLGSPFSVPVEGEVGRRRGVPLGVTLPVHIPEAQIADDPLANLPIRWGKPVSGLRVGILFLGATEDNVKSFRHGDLVQAELFVQNISRKNIPCQFLKPHPLDGWGLNIEDNDGKTLRPNQKHISMYSPRQFFSAELAAGEIQPITGNLTRFKSENEDENGADSKLEHARFRIEVKTPTEPQVRPPYTYALPKGLYKTSAFLNFKRTDIPDALIPITTGEIQFRVGTEKVAVTKSNPDRNTQTSKPGEQNVSDTLSQAQGRWIVETLNEAGEECLVNSPEELICEIEGNILRYKVGTKDLPGPILLVDIKDSDPSPTEANGPMPVDFVYFPNGDSETNHGIIACDDDTLSICMATEPAKSKEDFRPTLFVAGSKVTMWKCRRAPLDTEKTKVSDIENLEANVLGNFNPNSVPPTTKPKLLKTWEEVETHIASLVKKREKIVNADVELKLKHSGSYVSQRRYHVWLNGNNRRADCRGISSDGTEHYTHIITPTFSWYGDHQDSDNSQLNRRDPKDPVGWGTLGCVIDVRKIGLVNWSIESLSSHRFDDDLLPDGYTNPRVETGEHEGNPITIVKMDRASEKTARAWTEFWLSPAHGNFPVYIANGWTQKEDLGKKYVISQHTDWKLIDGIWFPTRVKHRYQCENSKIDNTGTYELIAAELGVAPAPEVFDPLEVKHAPNNPPPPEFMDAETVFSRTKQQSAIWFQSGEHVHFAMYYPGTFQDGVTYEEFDVDDNPETLWRFDGVLHLGNSEEESETYQLPVEFDYFAPGFQLKIDGKKYDLAKGRVFVLDFKNKVQQLEIPIPSIGILDKKEAVEQLKNRIEKANVSDTASQSHSAYDDFLQLLPADGTALVMLNDDSEDSERMREVFDSLKDDSSLKLVPVDAEQWKSVFNAKEPCFLLFKDRELVGTRKGLMTETQLRAFASEANDYLTPKVAGVDPRSIVRVQCSIGWPKPYPYEAAVVAQYEGRTLLLGSANVVKYMKQGAACLLAIPDQDGKIRRYPFDVIFAGPVKITDDGEPVEHGMAVYSVKGVPKLPTVRLATIDETPKVGETILGASFRAPFREPPYPLRDYQRSIFWQQQQVTAVDQASYGPSDDGPPLIDLERSGDQIRTSLSFNAQGKFVGNYALGHERIGTSHRYNSHVFGPATIRAVLQAAKEKVHDKELLAELEKAFGPAKASDTRNGTSPEIELGVIDVPDGEKRILVRKLHTPAPDSWQYRVYLPPDTPYEIEFYHNTGSKPAFNDGEVQIESMAVESGQYTITASVAESIVKPNETSVECFMVSLTDRVRGISFLRSDVRFLENSLGHYQNAGFRLTNFPHHNEEADAYPPGASIDLLHVKDESTPPKLINGKPREIIIRLVPRNIKPDVEGAKNTSNTPMRPLPEEKSDTMNHDSNDNDLGSSFNTLGPQDRRVCELIYQLRNYFFIARDEHWPEVVGELIEAGEAAVPWLIRELEGTDEVAHMRSLGFILCQINDPRSVPALIRAVGRPRRWRDQTTDGESREDSKIIKAFLASDDFWHSPILCPTGCGPTLPEPIQAALERITGHMPPKHATDRTRIAWVWKPGEYTYKTVEVDKAKMSEYRKRQRHWQS